MGRVVVTALVGLLLALAGSAQAGTTLVLPDGTERPEPYQAWVDRARVPTPEGAVVLDPVTPCPAAPRSCITSDDRIHLQPLGDEAPKWTLLHELGHLFDRRHLSEGERNRFRRLAHDDRPWRTTPNSSHEQFAEAYAACARSTRWPPRDFGYGYWPSVKQHRAVCGFVRRAATAP